LTSESRMTHLHQKGMESDYNGSDYVIGNGQTISGLKMAPKVLKLFIVYNLISPMHPQYLGRNSVRNNEGAEGIGVSKKRTIVCNALYRGSKFASIRKGADLLNGVLW
jgi:hypothetical protein